jgi:hypothetical protein
MMADMDKTITAELTLEEAQLILNAIREVPVTVNVAGARRFIEMVGGIAVKLNPTYKGGASASDGAGGAG